MLKNFATQNIYIANQNVNSHSQYYITGSN